MDSSISSIKPLPKLTSHPSSSTELSSAVSNLSDHLSIQKAAERRLQAYTPQQDGDDIVAFFEVVMKYLPKSGGKNLMWEISSFDNDEDLRTLRAHLIDCLFKPSKHGIRETGSVY